MKKLLVIILSVMLFSCAFAGNFDGEGVFTGWKFVPIQVGLGLDSYKNLFDQNAFALIASGLVEVKQQSAFFSLGAFSEIGNNYGIQIFLQRSVP